MTKRRPKGKVEVTLYFDDQNQAEIFGANWLDGGGDQQIASIFTDSWGKDWYYLKTSENACPECGYLDHRFYDVERVPGTLYQCENCPKKYVLK